MRILYFCVQNCIMDKVKGKFATTIDEQIELLSSRGMTFGSEEKARENLLDIGYYRLGFYWFPFEVSFPRTEKRDHKFKEGTLFENVIQLYYFDFDVRNLFLRYISRIEINFRTKLIYIASNFFKDNPFWYVDKPTFPTFACQGVPKTQSRRTEATCMVSKARTLENKLSKDYLAPHPTAGAI